MRISECIAVIRKENPLLFRAGLLHFLLAALLLVLMIVDHQQLMGVNRWIKPLKFSLSIAVYLWTFGWLLRYLSNQRTAHLIGWGITICMLAEIIIITIQASRGVTSHSNVSTPLNATLFSVMGIFIGANSILNLHTWVLFVFGRIQLEGNMKLAWQVGLFLFLIGGIAGGMMIGNAGHTIGLADGGAGIPFLNWSTKAGDLRSAHFVTLHGLQVIPLFAYFVSLHTNRPRMITLIFSIFYFAICVQMHRLALGGHSFLDFFSA